MLKILYLKHFFNTVFLLDLKNILNQQSNDGMEFLTTTPPATTASGATGVSTTTTTSTSSSSTMNPNANNSSTTLPPPLIPTQQQQHQTPPSVSNPMLMDYAHSNSTMMPPAAVGQTILGTSTAASSSRPLENLMIFDNFDVHETHRIEDGICTQLSRLPPKKQELLKQFGIQTNQTVTYYEKYILIENFNRFCNVSKETKNPPTNQVSTQDMIISSI